MERPTLALHLTRVTLSPRQLGVEPHTKEVGRAAVYNHPCLRSARRDYRRRRLVPGQRLPASHSLTSESPTILRFVERLRRTGPVACCYEAGPYGFELQRALTPEADSVRRDRAGVDSAACRRSHQDRSARCGTPRHV